MRTIDYIDVLNGTFDLAGISRDQAQGVEFPRFRDFHSNRLRQAYQHVRWPELMRVERRQYRQSWSSATTYAALDERFYPNTESYYVALRASTNEAPADADGETNNAYWALLGEAEPTTDWAAGIAYTVGRRVINPSDLKTYQCHTAHTSTSTFDSTKFGEVPEFIRDVDYVQSWESTTIGDVVEVWDRNPRTNQNAREVEFEVEDDRIIVLEHGVVRPWIQYRLRCPRLFGDVYSASASYSAGQQIFYSGGTERGNFYDVLDTTSAGQTPLTNAAKFRKVEIPEMFGPFLKQAALADWMPAEGEDATRRSIEQGRANDMLAQETQRALAQQRQMKRTRVFVR